MKILYIVGFYPEIGGPYTVVRDLTKALHNKGIKVGVYSVLPRGYTLPVREKYNYLEDLVYLESPRSIMSHFWPSFSTRWNKVSAKINKYDLIHVNGIFDYYAFFIYMHAKKPYIISPRGTLMRQVLTKKSYILKNLYMLSIGKKILNSAIFVHALTKEEQMAVNRLGVSSKKICVIPNGINPQNFLDLPERKLLIKKYPYLKGKKKLLFLGRINWKKGLDDLIPAFSEVNRKIKNAHLLLVGPDEEGYMKKVYNLIRDYKLTGSISYMGPAYGYKKMMFYQDSDIFILPSYSEGFPNTVLEAMYMGLPVITTTNSGISDDVKDSKCGIIINKNKGEIANAVIRLLENNDLARKMGENGKNLVKNKFVWDKVAERMVKFYRLALRNRKGS